MLTASLAATGTRTPVSCVTGRDTHPYTIATSSFRWDVGCLMTIAKLCQSIYYYVSDSWGVSPRICILHCNSKAHPPSILHIRYGTGLYSSPGDTTVLVLVLYS